MLSSLIILWLTIGSIHLPNEAYPPSLPVWLNDGTIQDMTASDRCGVRDCTCRVVPGAVRPLDPTQISDSHRHNVFFEENEYSLIDQQHEGIRGFSSKFSKSAKIDITLVGYTDGCGSYDSNRTLSSQRARVVTEQIKRSLPNANVSFQGAGEVSSGHDPRSRRVDILVQVKSNLANSIERVKADVYLIDASGSLWSGWDGWTNVINASFRPGSRIYLSKMFNCHNGSSIDNISPAGGTEIWWSYWVVLDEMQPGETLAIISDFDSNYALSDWEHRAIQKKVWEKRVRVIVIEL